MAAIPALCDSGVHRKILLLVVALCAGLHCCMSDGAGAEVHGSAGGGGAFEMRLVYKYSEQFRELTKGRPGWEHVATEHWPRQGTPEFYHTLVMSDRHRHASRNLLTADIYSLAPTNATYYVSVLGAIQYTFISLGTPAQEFLVGLDTGSDLLWVPCDCQQCAVANWAAYGLDIPGQEFAIYSPSNSSTSKVVACNSDICMASLNPTACDVAAPKSCTYLQKYAAANTSSSGAIVQDVLYLNRESKSGPQFSTNIYFGCGTVQTGDFLGKGAPDGLFGLGPQPYSVPSTLARAGVTQSIFSMCFTSVNESGRLKFGKTPDASFQSTPLIPTTSNVYYVVEVKGIMAGGVMVNLSGAAVFDSGTSITYLPSDVVKAVGDAISAKATLKPWPYTSQSLQVVLDYCWNATTKAEVESLSSLSFIFAGGGIWQIMDPLVGFGSDGILDFICLGIISSENPIIGFNFMSHYEYFFDLGNSTLSWGPSDCSTSNATTSISVAPLSAPSPSVQSPPPSSRPTVQAPPPKSPVSGNPQTPESGGLQLSKAHLSSQQHTAFLLVCLTILIVSFDLLANKMS